MIHRRIAQVAAAACTLGLTGVALTPAVAGAHPGSHAKPGHAKQTHAKKVAHKRHTRHHGKPKPAPVPAPAAGTQSAVADFSSGPFHLQFNAQRAAGAPATAATGTFSATASAGSATFMTLSGPVTCLDVVGHTMGLFYPVTAVTPAAEGALVKGVYIYAQTDASGKPTSLTFEPSTSATATSCTPLPGLLPVTSGTLSLTS